MVNYFEENSLLVYNQHGFRNGHSTSTAIMDYVQFFYQEADKRKLTSSIVIDYKRAFETIDQYIV